jgi:hypothetical protein
MSTPSAARDASFTCTEEGSEQWDVWQLSHFGSAAVAAVGAIAWFLPNN